jgi:hypothetical protein
MRGRKNTAETTKVKIGTILDKRIVDKLKQRAIRDGKPISAIIEEAVLQLDRSEVADREVRLKALNSFLSMRFNLTKEDWDEIMQEDYYDQ